MKGSGRQRPDERAKRMLRAALTEVDDDCDDEEKKRAAVSGLQCKRWFKGTEDALAMTNVRFLRRRSGAVGKRAK